MDRSKDPLYKQQLRDAYRRDAQEYADKCRSARTERSAQYWAREYDRAMRSADRLTAEIVKEQCRAPRFQPALSKLWE